MRNWFTVIVPTIYDDSVEIDQDKLKEIADECGVDALTLKNVFIGRGLGFLLKTPDYSKIERIVSVFERRGIPCLPANASEVIEETKIVNAVKVYPLDDGIKIISDKHEVFTVNEKIVVLSDNPFQEIPSVKRLVLNSGKIALITAGKVFYLNLDTVRIFTKDGKKGVSQRANLINILEYLEKKGKVSVDGSFYFQTEFFLKDFLLLARFISYAMQKNFYEKRLPRFLFKLREKRENPVFNHKVVSNPIKANLFNYRKNLRDRIVYPPAMLLPFALFFLYLGARFRTPFFIWLVFAVCFVVFTLKLFRVWKIMHLIEDIPTSKLRSVAAGFVEVKGRITSDKPVISPVSGSPCVYFHYVKQEFVIVGRHAKWRTIEAGEGMADFCVLRDETGEIGVNLKNASFFLTTKYTTNTTFMDMQYGLIGSDNIRYVEEYILDNQTVYVLGTAKPVSKSVNYGKFLSEIKKDKNKMKRFDLDGNGVIDAEEWEKAQKKLRDEFLEFKQLKGQGADLVIDLDKSNGIFIVSNEKETKLLKRLKIALPFYFAGSILCLVLTLWLSLKIF